MSENSPYSVTIRGDQYVIVDTRSGQVKKPAYGTRNKAEKECAVLNTLNALNAAS